MGTSQNAAARLAMKAWQRKIREKEAQKDPRAVVGLENATVVEISFEKAKELNSGSAASVQLWLFLPPRTSSR
jgi:hypothetical protein